MPFGHVPWSAGALFADETYGVGAEGAGGLLLRSRTNSGPAPSKAKVPKRYPTRCASRGIEIESRLANVARYSHAHASGAVSIDHYINLHQIVTG